MAVRASVSVDTTVLERIEKAMSTSPKLMQTATERQLTRIRSEIKSELQTAPPQSGLPFVWSFDKAAQRRALAWYFKNKVPRGSRGGRYQRTGKLAKAWRVSGNYRRDDGTITLTNNAPGARYVFGDRQVPSHRKSNWPTADAVAAKYRPILNERLKQTWITVADPFAGVR